jgi:cell division protein FtsW
MSFLYDCVHNLSERIKYGKWMFVIFPVLFSIIGIYVGISTSDKDIIPFKNVVFENVLLPLAFFIAGFLLPVSLWRRYAIRFSYGRKFLWNKDGFSFAFLLLVFAVALQCFAIWGDKTWDKIPVNNETFNLNGFYTEAQLKGIDNNGITQLRRQLSVFSRPFQVGEFVKIFLMLFVAKLITDMKVNNQMKLCREFFGFPLLFFFPVGFLTFLMPNYSMMLIYMLMIFFMLFVQEMDLKPRFIMIIALIIPVAMVFSIADLDKNSHVAKLHGVNRIWNFFNEEGTGNEQQKDALQALADGGITGKGLDKGTIKLRLFGARNDFAYSILGEELGMWLLLPITLAMAGFLFACFWVAAGIRPKDRDEMFAQNVAWGIAIIFTLNIFFHIGVNLRLLPNTGQPLSFISAGGANLIMNFFLMGMLIQISSLGRNEKA